MGHTVSEAKYREFGDGMFWIQECLPLGNISSLDRFDSSVWMSPNEEAHGCQNAYLLNAEQSLLFDTLTQPNADNVIDLLHDILEGESLDYLVISHPEANHAGNTFKILDAYPDANLLVPGEAAGYGSGFDAEHELYDIAADHPRDISNLSNEIRYVGDGDTLNLGGYSVEFHEPVFADHSFTIWMSEVSTDTLFSVDWLGFLHPSSNCLSYANELDFGVSLEQVFRFHALAFPWLRFSDQTEISAGVQCVADQFDPTILAPAHGMVMRGDLSSYLSLFSEAVAVLSEEGAYENMRSKLDYVLRSPEDE